MRGFLVVALLCIGFALLYNYAGCEPNTESCDFDATTHQYICPNER